MNTLFLTLLYHPDEVEAVSRLSRDGLQNQINNYQWAFIDGLRQQLEAGETLSVLNALPVGVFPHRYRSPFLKTKVFDGHFRQLGGFNLPGLKQRGRAKKAEQEIEAWLAQSPDNRTLLLYTLYLPYMQAVIRVKRRHPEVRAAVIVTDLPNELGIASGRRGWLKRIEYRMGDKRLLMCAGFDGFILLTAPMAEALHVTDKPCLIMEGLIRETPVQGGEAAVSLPEDSRPAVLYTGTLNRELGLDLLLEAFAELPEAQLWLCGRGDMEAEIKQAVQTHHNIHYFGFVPQGTALMLQQQATVLINPRTACGAFTRYSFPSKTLEYMRSGKPVLCCKLEGIPQEYDATLSYIEPQTAQGIRQSILALLEKPEAERAAMGEKARAFVLREKNARAQCSRLMAFLRGLAKH